MRRLKQMMVLSALILALVITSWNVKRVLAHERLEITENDEPVTGVEATLDTELLYGGRTFRSNLAPTLTPGQYTVEIFPTIRGQYNVRLFGAIGETEVDAVVEPEEVFSAERIQFPEPLPDTRELQEQTQQQIAELESRLQIAQLIAIGGALAGLVGMVVSFFVLLRQR